MDTYIHKSIHMDLCITYSLHKLHKLLGYSHPEDYGGNFNIYIYVN